VVTFDPDLAALAEVRDKARRAQHAFAAFEGTDQTRIDAIVRAMARAGSAAAEELAEMAAQETGYGLAADKVIKNRFNTDFVANWMLGLRTVGVLWVDEENRMLAIGAPMGVIAALIPVTNPTSTVLFKSLAAVKSGNAIVHSPHPRASACCRRTAEVMAEAAVRAGAPEGLISCIEATSLEATHELMRHPAVALVLATGGGAMVRAAYSSGKPTIAVGPGNVPVYVHRSAPDLAEAAEMIVSSKSFDYGTACVAEQSVVVDDAVADTFIDALARSGLVLLDRQAADRLARIVFDERGGLRPEHVGQSAVRLATLIGARVDDRTRALGVELDRVGMDEPLSREILGPVLSIFRVAGVDDGFRRCREILALGGEGHTVGVHASDNDVIARFSQLPAGRVLVNTPALFGGMGYSAAIDPSFQLGTGTWSGSICSDNVTPLHLINIKRVAHEVRPWRSVFDRRLA
jgi:acetaldehyde dehydrogenase (acetylating)